MIEPDYTKTTGQVYGNLVLRYVENRNLLALLRHCDLRNDTSADMLTWVPNWDVANMAERMAGDGKANGHNVAEEVHKGGGGLNVTGVISATITNAQETLFLDNNYMTGINKIRRLAPINFENRTYVSGGSLLDALTSTFCANTFSITTRPPTARWPLFEQSRDLVRAILRYKTFVPDHDLGADESKYLDFSS